MSQSKLSPLDDPTLLQLPALTPPPGVIPNFAHPMDRGPVLTIVNGILLALMMIFIALRVYTKLAIVRKISWDDLTVSLSALGSIFLYILFVWRTTLPHHVIERIFMYNPSQKSEVGSWGDTSGI